ncbi:MAG: DUF502 domain-containing protein [Phycisphaerae bacterium]|jgi:uncharacterized membrane protein|nr:DUF502 domain-containing protein [Phycisphaerae bacterium]MDP7290354.1 DUF502 domain-containing protein [Phycisphaerae bacterium]
MKKQLGILLAGIMVLVPLVITAYTVYWLGSTLDALGGELLPNVKLPPGVGALILIVGVYIVGLATRLWLFQAFWSLLEKLITHMPGVKMLYESVRDLLQLFGGDAGKMGQVVQYSPPGSNMKMLGIRTNEQPPYADGSGCGRTVAVYLPFSYMFGGITVYCRPDQIEEIDMPVEQCMKLCATAFVGQEEPPKNES